MRNIKILGIILLLISTLSVFANNKSIIKSDTNFRHEIDKSKYKLSKYEFLEKYGDNDTIAEMINLYFRKRNMAFINPEFLISLSLIGVALSYDSHICNDNHGYHEGCFPIHTFLSAYISFLTGSFSAIRAPIYLSTYSRLNLYIEIEEFLKTGQILKNRTKRKVYRRLN